MSPYSGLINTTMSINHGTHEKEKYTFKLFSMGQNIWDKTLFDKNLGSVILKFVDDRS